MKAAVVLAALIVAGTCAALVACTSTPSGDPNATTANADNRYQCFDPAHVRSFQNVDDHTMVITSDWNQAYELKLGPACFDLDTSAMIGLRSRTGVGDVCGPFDADIVYSDMGSRPPQTCSITGVRHLTGDEAAAYVAPKKRQ